MKTHWIGVLGVLAALMSGAAFGPAEAQQSETRIIQGGGGGKIIDTCEPGYALVALNAVKSKDLNSLAGVCRKLENNLATGGPTGLVTRGDPNIDERALHTTDTHCAPPMVVVGVAVEMSNVNLVHNLAVICRNLVTGEGKQAKLMSEYFGGQAAMADEIVACSPGAYAVGVITYSGSMIDGVGLYCQVGGPQPVKPIKHTARGGPTTAKPDKPPINVLTGDDAAQDADNGGGGGNGGATAATDTTIYDQPNGNDVAYLSGGDPVTIVSCNDENWCRISRPQNGWVWGDDLDR
jgi:hypothetical protein